MKESESCFTHSGVYSWNSWELHVRPVSEEAWSLWVAARSQVPYPTQLAAPNDWEADLELV